MSPGIVGVLGGTFDPIHLGHLDVARAAHDALGLERILLMPAHVPPHRHRAPHASAYHRFAMTALAAQDAPYLVADDAELRVDGPSYTAHTLARLATTGYAPSQIVFITGVDAFAEIATWYAYPRVLDAAHFAVVTRPGHRLVDLAARGARGGRRRRGARHSTRARTHRATRPLPSVPVTGRSLA